MTILSDTVEQFPESVRFICKHSKAKRIRAEPLYIRGRAAGKRLNPPSPSIFVTKFRKAREVAKKYARVLAYSGARLDTLTSTFCSYTAPTFGVTPEGFITCCYEVLQSSDPLANQFFYGRVDNKSRTFQIDLKKIDNIRRTALKVRELCKDCFCVWHCAGDCAAKTLHTYTNSKSLTDRCLITRELTKDQLLATLFKKG